MTIIRHNLQTIGRNGKSTWVCTNSFNTNGIVMGDNNEEVIVINNANDLFPPITSIINGRDIPAGMADNKTSAKTRVGVVKSVIQYTTTGSTNKIIKMT